MDDVVRREILVSEINDPEIEEKEESQTMDFNNPDFRFEPRNCNYRQRGYFLVCRTCDLEHGIFIGSDKVMVGVDEENRPIVKTRSEMNLV